jgi:luciferase family oxidoreductase group 1
MVPISVLDLAAVTPGQSVKEALSNTVALAQHAERLGVTRIWYAEHHNLPSIASSAPAVLIAHVAAHTTTIRLGAGGVMLPNHSPLTVAEQFGTLWHLHPGRIDLGLGRAPGSDQTTFRALRRSPDASDAFPQDVLELQAFLGDESRVPGVHANPGRGTHVPLYILGSSLFGATLAAALGLPYSFASHFAPAQLEEAVTLYRRQFQPSAQLKKPYVIAGLNLVVAPTREQAEAEFHVRKRGMVMALFGRGRPLSEGDAEALLGMPAGQQVSQMLSCAAVGTPDEAVAYAEAFTTRAQADELIMTLGSPTLEGRMRSLDLFLSASARATPSQSPAMVTSPAPVLPSTSAR